MCRIPSIFLSFFLCSSLFLCSCPLALPSPNKQTKQNRDRLELYALQKQAMQGDAPTSGITPANPGDRAKLQAWRSKAGLVAEDAMRLYCQEADRQVRVYGTSAATTASTSTTGGQALTPLNTPATGGLTNAGGGRGGEESLHHPRGLAAIPLLCAAASESRQAYLRRLSNTPLRQAWWRRQEPLTATPGSLWAFPEYALLSTAAALEYGSLRIQVTTEPTIPILSHVPPSVIQSLLWPLHNSLLAWWMGCIVVFTAWTAALDLVQTILFGTRRTGLSLQSIWNDQVLFLQQSIHSLTEPHQPVSARIVGLVVSPLSIVIRVAGILTAAESTNPMLLLATCLSYCFFVTSIWWYWVWIVPILVLVWCWAAMGTGFCYALIEWVGV